MADNSPRNEAVAALWEVVPDHVAYHAARESLTRLLEQHPDSSSLPLPACPDWTVRDTVAHLVDICRLAQGWLVDGPAPLPGPDAGPGFHDLLAEWAERGQAAEALLVDTVQFTGPLILDVYSHELDIRRVLEVPPPDDHPAAPRAMKTAVGGFTGSVHAHGLPALRIEVPGASWVVGAGEPVVTVRGHRHDLYRSLTGRRSLEQIAALSWSASPAMWLPAFEWGPFQPPLKATEDAIDSTN